MSRGRGTYTGANVRLAREHMAGVLAAAGSMPCWLCGDWVSPADTWVVEHKVPIALGGPEMDPTNWSVSHRKCSDSSGSKVRDEKKLSEEMMGDFSGEKSRSTHRPVKFPHTETSPLLPIPTDLQGTPTPRLFTPPLVNLDQRENSAGYECIEWCEQNLGIELLPWQKWFLIHALELTHDGSFRFSTVLLLVSRQNGKTTVIECLTSWLLATRPKVMVLGTSTAQELAREPWSRVADHMEALDLATRITRGSIDTSIHTANGSRYKIAAATRRGGRSLSVDLLVLDELREMLDDWEAYNALTGTTTARPNALTLALTNAGDYRSVVLNGLRDSALDGADPSLGIFEWSAPENASLDDLEAVAQANPALGATITPATLTSKRAQMPEAGYRTEHLCQRVDSVEPGDTLCTPLQWDALSTTQPTGTPTACAVEAWFGEGVSVAYAWLQDSGAVTVHAEHHDTVQSAADAVRARFSGTVTVGASLLSDPALRGIRTRAGQGRVTVAVSALSRLIQESSVRHTGDEHLTEQVLTVRTAGSSEGLRMLSKSRADALKAAVWSIHDARKPSIGKPRLILPRT